MKFLLKNEKGVEGLVNDEQWRESFITVRIADISTTETLYLHLPECMLVRAYTVLSGAIITVDATVKLYKNAQILTNGTITLAVSGSAAGVLDSCVPTVHNEFIATDYLKIVAGGESTNAVPVLLTIEIAQKA